MKPINIGGHSAYQERVLTQLRKYYPNAATSLSPSSWQILDKFWNLDLSPIDDLMQNRYSVFGPEPRFPSDMLRAILVSVEFKITSYTRFAADLKENYLHAIISGFSVGDTPGIGTFYDFHRRLWLSPEKNLSNPVHPPKSTSHIRIKFLPGTGTGCWPTGLSCYDYAIGGFTKEFLFQCPHGLELLLAISVF